MHTAHAPTSCFKQLKMQMVAPRQTHQQKTGTSGRIKLSRSKDDITISVAESVLYVCTNQDVYLLIWRQGLRRLSGPLRRKYSTVSSTVSVPYMNSNSPLKGQFTEVIETQ